MKAIWAWLKLVVARLGRIVTELLSVKTVIAVVMTYVYLKRSEALGLGGFFAVTVLWLMVIGLRYAAKAKAIITGEGK